MSKLHEMTKHDMLCFVDDFRRVAAEESQLARWDMEDCHALEHRLLETLDPEHHSYLTTRLAKLRASACASQRRSALHYARVRFILGIDDTEHEI